MSLRSGNAFNVGGKAPGTQPLHCCNELIYNAFHRTALATPGLLIIWKSLFCIAMNNPFPLAMFTVTCYPFHEQDITQFVGTFFGFVSLLRVIYVSFD